MAENVTIPHFTFLRDMFSNYFAIKKAIKEYRQDTGTAKEMSQQSFSKTDKIPMKQVEAEAFREMLPVPAVRLYDGTKINNPEMWIDVIDSALNHITDNNHRAAISMWIMHMPIATIIEETKISKALFYVLKSRVIDCGVILAYRKGLLKVEHTNKSMQGLPK